MSKIISVDEANNLSPVPMGKKHPVRAAIEAMKANDILQISREEFRWKKRTPMVFCNQVARATGKKFEIKNTLNKKHWLVYRLG